MGFNKDSISGFYTLTRMFQNIVHIFQNIVFMFQKQDFIITEMLELDRII